MGNSGGRFSRKEAIRQGKWKAVRLDPKKPTELYDLERDLGEQNDLAKEHPEVVKRMEALMAQAVE